jgi:hypothetical protein
MMMIRLDEPERHALVRALDAYLELLTTEAARTEEKAAEHDLWQLKEQLEAIRTRLSTAVPEGLEHEHPGVH